MIKEYIYYPDTGLMNVSVRSYPSGYKYFGVGKKKVMVHEYAFYFMTGKWPNQFVDHKDLNKGNNIWINLRLADKSQNAKNRRKLPGKYIGVRARGKLFEWRMRINYKEINQGGFRCPTQAAIARDRYILSIGDEFSTLNVLARMQ